MKESEEKGVPPLTDETINVHDLLAGNANSLTADVKQEPYASDDDLFDVKDVLDRVDASKGMVPEVGTSQEEYFCALCRLQVAATVPKVVVGADPAFKESIRDMLLRKHSKWKVDFTLAGPKPRVICHHHLKNEFPNRYSVSLRRWRSVCTLCENDKILVMYTTVIPPNLEGQRAWREKIFGAPFSLDRLEKMFALARYRDERDEPLRLCNDHLENCDIPIDPGTQKPSLSGWTPSDNLCVEPEESMRDENTAVAFKKLRERYANLLRKTTQREAHSANLVGSETHERIQADARLQLEVWRVQLESIKKGKIRIESRGRRGVPLTDEQKRQRKNKNSRERIARLKREKMEKEMERRLMEEAEREGHHKEEEKPPREESSPQTTSLPIGSARIQRRRRERVEEKES